MRCSTCGNSTTTSSGIGPYLRQLGEGFEKREGQLGLEIEAHKGVVEDHRVLPFEVHPLQLGRRLEPLLGDDRFGTLT